MLRPAARGRGSQPRGYTGDEGKAPHVSQGRVGNGRTRGVVNPDEKAVRSNLF